MTRTILPRSVLLLTRRTRSPIVRRGIHSSRKCAAAHEFTMPAMSLTMTEGNITGWKVQEGEGFSAGDVLLEIETDKAQMDVEAQDDGVMAKILFQSGAKAVKVGTRVAITADVGDELDALDLSAIESTSASISSVQKDFEPEPKSGRASTSDNAPAKERHESAPRTRNLQYPLFPSVLQLIREYNISDSILSEIAATGPNGRLLKGDVLAHLGNISASYVNAQSKHMESLSHLDLSNVEVSRSESKPAEASNSAAKHLGQLEKNSEPEAKQISLPISLAAVHEVQKRVQESLGITLNVETFIARATQICNIGLPKSASQKATSDEMFNAVLGLSTYDSIKPAPLIITDIQQHVQLFQNTRRESIREDEIDELTAPRRENFQRNQKVMPYDSDATLNLFSVTVPAGDEKRGKIFLQRLKTALQVEPGQLVL